jgi:hypothetical protein
MTEQGGPERPERRGYPSRFERVLKDVRDVLLIVWLFATLAAMVLVMAGAASYANWLSNTVGSTPAPAPSPTDCIEGWDC